jgi:hypothetical protein
MRSQVFRLYLLVALLLVLFLALGAVVAGLASGCWREAPPAGTEPTGELTGEPWFADITGESGLDFVHDAGPVGKYFMPQSIGSGAAVLDFTEDGGVKYLYLLHNGGPRGKKNQLFERRGGRFRDVSRSSGLAFAGYCMGVAVGDVNNDGRPDVLVTLYTGVKLFLNNGDGTFTDVTEESGLSNPAWGVSAAFFDYDRDGWLDLVLVNYVDYDPTWPCPSPSGAPEYCGPRTFHGRVCKLFHNLGEKAGKGKGRGVRFEDVTVKSGLAGVPGPGLGVVCADFDGDGWPDVLVVNDGQANCLWMNQHDGTFREEAIRRGVAFNGLGTAQAGMGVALGDVDGDGLFDLYITHMPEEGNTLWRQGPRGLFVEHTAAAGLAAPIWRGTGFGTVMADFDHNGALDIAAVNGRIARAPTLVNAALGPHWGRYADRNQLFANDGQGRFRDVSAQTPALCGTANVARGLLCADFDGDGAVDLLVTSIADRARLLRNVAPKNRGHWLMVRAVDPALGSRDAYGALVRVRAAGRQWLRLINPAGSYLCSGDVRAHFGLGQKAARVDALEVTWPDGTVEVFPGCGADRQVVLCRGAGKQDKETRRQGDKETGR